MDAVAVEDPEGVGNSGIDVIVVLEVVADSVAGTGMIPCQEAVQDLPVVPDLLETLLNIGIVGDLNQTDDLV